jgi:hypothetical protein
VVVPAVRDHLGGLTARKAGMGLRPASTWPVTRPGPALEPLVTRIHVEPPTRRNPRGKLSSSVVGEAGGVLPPQVDLPQSHQLGVEPVAFGRNATFSASNSAARRPSMATAEAR